MIREETSGGGQGSMIYLVIRGLLAASNQMWVTIKAGVWRILITLLPSATNS